MMGGASRTPARTRLNFNPHSLVHSGRPSITPKRNKNKKPITKNSKLFVRRECNVVLSSLIELYPEDNIRQTISDVI